jgi:curli biogenesis system outer membrane secretion channel CsgG
MDPVVGVTDFENRSNFSGQWNLGTGMAELLVNELLDSGRVTVLERKHLKDVLAEIALQSGSLFRKEGQVERGRLKNAKFLIRGVVTDFTVTSEGAGWFGIRSFRARGSGSRARVAISIKVSDVENGEIISSVKADGTASAGGFGANYSDGNVAFGGDAFFRTPIGRATEAAIAKAVRQILRELPVQYWEPRVAEAGPDTVVINGGANVGLQEGEAFLVREDGRNVTDPITGNVIERIPGQVVGKVKVVNVREQSAHAVILQGLARRGHLLEPVLR